MASSNKDYQVGKAYNFYYDSDVRKCHVLAILPHPTDPNDRLIAFRYFGKYRQWWHYALIEESELEMGKELVSTILERRKKARQESKKED